MTSKSKGGKGDGGGKGEGRRTARTPAVTDRQLLDRHAHGKAERDAIGALVKSLTYDPNEVIRPILDPDALKEEAQALTGSLRMFIREAWPIIEPQRYIHNWHIDAIAEHLEAVTAGDISDLLITMPPRHTKSLIVSVLWPTWEWLTLPSYRWVFTSYAFNLSVRDSVKRRTIFQSKWWAERFADRFTMIKEQNNKIRYQNDKNGFMLASSVGGSNTGEGGERIVTDDPHNVKKSESEQVRLDTVNWWNIVMSTRRNSEKSARIAMQQRTHEADVAGDIIERGGYVHLNLPAEFVPTARCFTSWTEKKTGKEHKWQDPRTFEGELLNPLRKGVGDRDTIEKMKLVLGDYQYAAQYQQNPTPPTGTIIRAEWIRYYGGPTGRPIPDWIKCTHALLPMLSLDCTFKEHKDTDYVAGLGFAMFGADIYVLPVCIHERLSFTATIDRVAEFVGGKSLDQQRTFEGIFPFIKVKLVEDKANGSAVISTLQHQIPGMVAFEPGSSNKESRLIAGSWRFKAGNIYLPHESIAPWVKEYVYELCAFPKAKRDDYVDATSQALIFIGGDPVVEGAPTGQPHDSMWTRMSDTDLGAGAGSWGGLMGGGDGSITGGASESRFGSVNGGMTRSIWRR